jgi:hypothetical protein
MHHPSSIIGNIIVVIVSIAVAFPLLAATSAEAASVASSSSSSRARTVRKRTVRTPVPPKKTASSSAASVQKTNAFPYTLPITSDWDKAWKVLPIEGTPESLLNVQVIQEQGQFPDFLRVNLPKGSGNRWLWKFLEKPLGGVYARVNPGITPQKDMYMSYSVRFPEGFDFRTGGGLPGISSGIQNGRADESAASAYVGWGKKGEISLYGDFKRKVSLPANVIETNASFNADGKWHRIDLHLGLNTGPGNANGFIEFFLDEKKIATNYSLYFMNRQNDAWDALSFVTGLSGVDVFSISPKDMHVDLAGFTFSDKPLLK